MRSYLKLAKDKWLGIFAAGAICLATVLCSATEAQADSWHNRSRYGYGGRSYNQGYSRGNFGHYSGRYYQNYRPHRHWHDTSHLDWHDTSHWDHTPWGPVYHRDGHFDYHRDGHWDYHH